jgi:type 1 glutamine amidotransferase
VSSTSTRRSSASSPGARLALAALGVFAAACGGAASKSGNDGSNDAPADTGDGDGSREVGGPDSGGLSDADAATTAPFQVLLFARTAGFPHPSIPAALTALEQLGPGNGFVTEATEDPVVFTSTGLARFQVVVFVMTTGDVLNAAAQSAFEAWIAGGGNFVGIHSATDTEYDWPFYGQLVGAYFKQHPAVQPADVVVETSDHPATAPLPARWRRTDEWYDFQANPRGNVTVLATVDESTYTGGTMGADHPIVWAHTTSGGGRAFYTAMGHTAESYADPIFRAHLAGAVRWAAGRP